MTDPTLSTVPLPLGVTATAEWGSLRRADGQPHDRYTLRWTWSDGARPGSLIMVGLNPSGAAEDVADRTLIRVMGYARREGFGSLLMLNLFSARATKPEELLSYSGDPGYARKVAHQIGQATGVLVAGWGSQSGRVGALVRDRVKEILPLVQAPWWCLGRTADGSPRHPLYLARDAALEGWRP
jgi:hypothetical protein